MTWVPSDFVHPTRMDLPTGHHLRPIRADDVPIDLPAVMGSRERLWSIYGEAWGWPPATMTAEQDREDLEYHEREMASASSYNYAVLDADETRLLGCVYIDPPVRLAVDAVVSWWLVDDEVGGPLEQAVAAAVPAWLRTHWPLATIHYGVEAQPDEPGEPGRTADADPSRDS